MPDRARLSPDELDRIEDALDNLEQLDEEILDPSPQVCDVLDAYREILSCSRDALPLQEVPRGALTAVFAEAHASVAAAQVVGAARAVEVSPTPKPSPSTFFARLRRSFVVPSLALAGTAGLVLWISRPLDGTDAMDRVAMDRVATDRVEGTPAAEQVTAPSPAPAQSKAMTSDSTTNLPTSTPANKPAPAEPVASRRKDAAGPGAPQAVPQDPAPPPAMQQAEAKSAKGEAAKPDRKLARAPAWEVVDRGDRARADGDCAAARQDYAFATEDDDPRVRARAYAGLGLCSLGTGDDADAADKFTRARGIDPAVATFIEAERPPSGPYRATKRRRPAKSPRMKKSKKSARPANADVLDDSLSP